LQEKELQWLIVLLEMYIYQLILGMDNHLDALLNCHLYRTRIESLILSSQISTERVNLSGYSVTLSFNIQLVCMSDKCVDVQLVSVLHAKKL